MNTITSEASTVAMAATTTIARLARMRSTSAPSGAVAAMPTSAPMVITRPISDGDHFSDCRYTPRKGPSPSRTSAMKKFSALSAGCEFMRDRNAAGVRRYQFKADREK